MFFILWCQHNEHWHKPLWGLLAAGGATHWWCMPNNDVDDDMCYYCITCTLTSSWDVLCASGAVQLCCDWSVGCASGAVQLCCDWLVGVRPTTSPLCHVAVQLCCDWSVGCASGAVQLCCDWLVAVRPTTSPLCHVAPAALARLARLLTKSTCEPSAAATADRLVMYELTTLPSSSSWIGLSRASLFHGDTDHPVLGLFLTMWRRCSLTPSDVASLCTKAWQCQYLWINS